jgi:sphingolipid 8-(E)-desaturase
MTRYQAEIVDCRWKDFIPPIQGGNFRKNELASVEDSEASGDSFGSESSGTASYISDTEGTRDCRRLYVEDAGLSTSPFSERSSTVPGIVTLLDSQTKQEIVLNLAKEPSLVLEAQEIIIQKFRMLNHRVRTEDLY